jgi:hypothetical protein
MSAPVEAAGDGAASDGDARLTMTAVAVAAVTARRAVAGFLSLMLYRYADIRRSGSRRRFDGTRSEHPGGPPLTGAHGRAVEPTSWRDREPAERSADMTEHSRTDSTAKNHAAVAIFRAEVDRMADLDHEAFHDLDPRTLPLLEAVIPVISREMPCS